MNAAHILAIVALGLALVSLTIAFINLALLNARRDPAPEYSRLDRADGRRDEDVEILGWSSLEGER